jgi:hypothetical protein
MRKLTFPSTVCKGRTDKWRLFDTPSELADFADANCAHKHNYMQGGSWYGGDNGRAATRKTRQGDLSRVPASDALMTKFERFAFDTERQIWADDISGGFPNVPAYLAGHPLAMRRRLRDESAGHPLAIIVDLTTSSGVSAKTIERRGAAILALTRILTMRRPVELWAGCMTGADSGNKNLGAVFCKLETQPLDVATAAYVMTSAAFPRALCYAISGVECGYSDGGWPYNDHSASRKHLPEICAQAFTHATETLCIPAIHISDDIADDPEGWIERKLSELAPTTLEAA